MFFSQEPEILVSVQRTESEPSSVLTVFSFSRNKMCQTMKIICLLFIFNMFLYFVFKVLIHQGIPNTLGK